MALCLIYSPTLAVVAGSMKNEDNIIHFDMENTRVEGTAEDVSTIECEIARNHGTYRARTDGAV